MKDRKAKPEGVSRFTLGFRVVPAGYSPYRLLDEAGNEVSQVNEFLDACAARGLSRRSLRAYGPLRFFLRAR